MKTDKHLFHDNLKRNFDPNVVKPDEILNVNDNNDSVKDLHLGENCYNTAVGLSKIYKKKSDAVSTAPWKFA